MTDTTKLKYPRLTDDDHGEITVTYDGKELRGWSYASDGERRTKMLLAREYVEGWHEGYGRALDRSEAIIHAVLRDPVEKTN